MDPAPVSEVRAFPLNAFETKRKMPQTGASSRVRYRIMADEDGHVLGLCRRNPPSYDGWPMTSGTDWCGEFRLARKVD